MAQVAGKFMNEPVSDHETIRLSRDTTLHRFNEDKLHVLVDGAGGYTAVIDPMTGAEKVVAEGHLSEFILH